MTATWDGHKTDSRVRLVGAGFQPPPDARGPDREPALDRT